MRNTKIKIAAAADRLFAERGFAEPGVEAVREAANVSIRTLYKHFPSKEAMVVGALAHRHERYLAHLRIEAPIEPGLAAILHLFGRVEDWMQKSGTRGCLFLQALAAHPDSDAIASEVARNKREVRREIGRRLPDGRDDVVPTLFLLHEGVTAAGENAAEAAREAVSIVRMVL